MTIETNFTASAEHVKFLGRTYYKENKLYCALSGSGAEFTFKGRKCTVTIGGDDFCSNPAQAENFARVGIFVASRNTDGKYTEKTRVIDDMIDAPIKTYTVWESEDVQEVTVSVVKLSESAMSIISINEICITSECEADQSATDAPAVIAPTANKDLFIEIVGDSITCGYGVDDPVAENHFRTETEDVTKSYSYKTVTALDADYSMVSFSGFGIISGYTENDKKVLTHLVPPLYDKLGFTWNMSKEFVPVSLTWDFKREPDLIVINLGTNDDSYTQDHEDRQEDYRANYTAFLKKVRSLNPHAKILCVLGMMGDRLFPFVQKAVDAYTTDTGDTNIHTMKFDVQLLEDGYVADYHPSLITHDKATNKLATEIKTLLKK